MDLQQQQNIPLGPVDYDRALIAVKRNAYRL